MNKLTLKQQRFVQEYLKSGNGTKAALNSYDTNDSGVAHSIASDNLRKPTIRKTIEQYLQVEGYTYSTQN